MASETTQHIAEVAHTTLVNALTTPTVASLHDHVPAPVSLVISDPASFALKRAAMVKAGSSRLQVIADFDRTVSAFRTANGNMCAASHQLLEECVGFNNKEFKPKMDAINTKYFALEIAHDLSDEVRANHMLDWWRTAHDLLLEQGIRRSAISDAVAKSRREGNLELRRGARPFLGLLQAAAIPCLVFSAGLKETIRVTLEQEGLAHLLEDNTHLIGNEMIFASEVEGGKLLSFGDDTITSSNKNYSHVQTMQPDYHSRSLQRRNVILMGDNLGDASMAKGMEDIETIIKIGFLHDNIEARMEQFKATFDIVLLNDADMSFAQELVQAIIDGKEQ